MAISDVLKTNYVDAAWSGNRLYDITELSSGSSTIVDVTDYTRQGSNFAANDINTTNRVIKEIEAAVYATRAITLSASNWSSTTTTVAGQAYYTYTVTVTAIYDPYPVAILNAMGTAAVQKAFGLLNRLSADVSTNTLTFYAKTKPTVNIAVRVKGVK